uniref:Late embryogenesis abundant protein n=1 Tax=Panagrellus redivivus TaxID=6233 RepID=A0A7E4VAC8_PANRE
MKLGHRPRPDTGPGTPKLYEQSDIVEKQINPTFNQPTSSTMSNQTYTESAKDKLNDMKEGTKEFAGNVKDKISGAAEATKDKAQDAAHWTGEKLGMAKDEAGNKCEHAKDCGHDYAQRFGDKTKEVGNRIQQSH